MAMDEINIRASVRIGFWAHYTINIIRSPNKLVGNYLGPYSTLAASSFYTAMSSGYWRPQGAPKPNPPARLTSRLRRAGDAQK